MDGSRSSAKYRGCWAIYIGKKQKQEKTVKPIEVQNVQGNCMTMEISKDSAPPLRHGNGDLFRPSVTTLDMGTASTRVEALCMTMESSKDSISFCNDLDIGPTSSLLLGSRDAWQWRVRKSSVTTPTTVGLLHNGKLERFLRKCYQTRGSS